MCVDTWPSDECSSVRSRFAICNIPHITEGVTGLLPGACFYLVLGISITSQDIPL